MDAYLEELVEVVYESDSARSVTHELEAGEPPLRFPKTLVVAEKRFRLVRHEVVSHSGRRTHTRLVYRPT